MIERPRGWAALAMLLMLAIVAGGVIAGGRAYPPGRPPLVVPARRVALAGAQLICPGRPAGTTATLMVASTAAGGGGSALVSPLAGGAARLLLADGKRVGTLLDPPGPVVIQARGAAAQGLAALEVARGSGLTVVSCGPATGNPRYFVGASGMISAAERLELDNPDATPALVDIAAWAPTGSIPAAAGLGLTVPARGSLTVPVASLAPDLAPLSLLVKVRVGRVATALVGGSQGGEFLPAQPGPLRRLLIAGFPSGGGARSLVVANPGARSATLRVRVLLGSRQFVPSGLQAVGVGPGGLTSIDLTGVLAGLPAAVELSSDQPVLAVGRARGAGGQTAWLPPAGKVSGSTPVALPARTATALIATAPGAAAELHLADAEPASVALPPGSTVEVALSGSGGGEAFLSATGGPVYVAVKFSKAGFALLALLTPASSVLARSVESDPAAAYQSLTPTKA
ncbi:MAG: DUF5719 family protein [Mycobacteriales bacterium]